MIVVPLFLCFPTVVKSHPDPDISAGVGFSWSGTGTVAGAGAGLAASITDALSAL